MDFIFQSPNTEQIKRERAKARELRKSQWWRNQLGQGVCYYCQNKFLKDDLTMDHVIPLARGGHTTKSNVVVCCKPCNSNKKHFTPVELTMASIES